MYHSSPAGAGSRRDLDPARQRRPSRAPAFSRLVLLAVLALVALVQTVSAAGPVIGIDYGSEWFKVATVRPGRPLDLVLNRESKRKTHSLLTLRKGERYFGSDSAALAPRFPSTTFPHLKSLLGKLANSTEAQEYAKVFPVKLTADPIRGTVRLAGVGDNETYSVEELVAMQLAHARSQAEETLKRPINDAVITIPPFLTQVERQSMLTAANLAGLRVLALLHDETAVAINYAMTRQFPKPQHHVFYDMGAGSTVASLIKFETERRTIKATVQSVGFDTSLGGLAIDALLADHLAAEFSAANKDKLKHPLASNPRARAKLLKEAARVKTILSVNSQVMAGIESLHEERNLRVVVTRAQLEEFVAPLKERALAPLRKALAGGALTADKLDSLVVVGGGVRVPQIQKWLEELVGADKIAKNVNGDEAAVLGATWRSAVLARSFKVQREIQVQDGLPYAVTIGAKGATLFPAQAPMVPYVPTTTSGVMKSVTIKKKGELVLPLGADELGASFATVYTKDLNESTSDQKLTFKLDTFGIVSITNATGTVTIPGSGGLLGIGKAPDTNETVSITVHLIQSIPALEGDELKAAETRLANWDMTERTRQAKEAARNSLESLVYSARDKSTDSNMEKVATPEEMETMGNAARAAGDWLEETDEDDMTVDQLKTKRAELATAMDVVVGRWRQVQTWFTEMRANAKDLNQTEAVTKWIDEYEEKDKFDLGEVKAKAGALQSQVDDKRKKEAEEAARKLAEELEKRKAEEEARRKAEAEELIRKAAEELAAKQKAEEAAAAEKDAQSNKTASDEAKPGDQPPSSSSTVASASSASPSSTTSASPSTAASTSAAKPTQEDTAKKADHDEL